MLSPRLFSSRSLIRSVALRSRATRLRVARPILAALPFAGIAGSVPMLAAPAVAAPAKLVGVQAWTSGSQTYIRVRPNASTPIVAKVAKHTPLYVWGKYNGWYRVQTHDDIFGWVHYELINSSALGKVKELAPAAVERAAKRSSDLTMWGTPAQLKTYYKKHGAKGAAKGLIEMGVPVTIGGVSRATKNAVAKPAPRKATTRKVAAPRPAAKPRVVTSSLATRVPVKSAIKKPVAQQFAPIIVAPSTQPALSAQNAVAPVRVLPPAPPKPVTRAKTSAPPKVRPAKRLTAKERRRQQLRAKMGTKTTTPPLPINQIAPVSPEDLMKARRAYLEARKKKLETTPEPEPKADPKEEGLGGPEVKPSSFERNANGSLDAQGWAPFNTGGWNGKIADLRFARAGFATADWNSESAPRFRLVTEEAEAATLGDDGLDDEELKRWDSLPKLESLETTTVANAQKKPAAKAAPSRGGSPRDRYKDAKGDFRKDMATQALSYRGRPYIFGASSPSKGFDCSGLIYYLLRQRGYNPPRTAAGYRNYGSAVGRKDLKPGDLLLFANTYKRGISHIGIYIGNNNFVHAASTRQGVRTDSLATKYYANKYYSARRVPKK